MMSKDSSYAGPPAYLPRKAAFLPLNYRNARCRTDLVAALVNMECGCHFDVETFAQVLVLGIAVEFDNLCFA